MSESYDLDESARALYQQFAGMDNSDHAIATKSGLIMQINQEEQKLDYYRLLLARSTCLFSGVLSNSLFASLARENDQKIKVLLGNLKRLKDYPGFDGKIYCRFRGKHNTSTSSGSEMYDYELTLGNLLLDHQMAENIEAREPIKGKAIHSQLLEAFKTLSVMKIFNFSIAIEAGEDGDYTRIDQAIRHLVLFHGKGPEHDKFLVFDEYEQPCINLTLLAAANRVQPQALQNLVNKVKTVMLGDQPPPEMNQFTTVYDVILSLKQYQQQLPRAPIEVNNVQWLTRNIESSPKRKTEAVQISRLVLSRYGSNPKMASEVLASVNSSGYGDIRSDVMGKRLTLATDFLKLADQTGRHPKVQQEALQNIEEGLDQVSDEVFDRLTIDHDKVSSTDEEGKTTSWSLHEKIMGLLSFFKQRSTTKKKVRAISRKNVQFDSEDFSVIARNFKITEIEASHLLELLQSCFDGNGRFRRNFFEKHIPEFVKYESKVFQFLWHYLKELEKRIDRVSFLNALQLLVARLTRPQDALDILLKDIFGRSSSINFSDRNGLILAIILLRSSNLEERSNIELTPEEVLQVRKSLADKMVQRALTYTKQNHETVIVKVRLITEKLLKSTSEEQRSSSEMQTRFLLFLLREMVIFFALIGGRDSQALVHGITNEFGNPHTDFYKNMKSRDDLRHALQFIQVAARSLRRFGDGNSGKLFEKINSQEAAFLNLFGDQSQKEYVNRVMEHILTP